MITPQVQFIGVYTPTKPLFFKEKQKTKASLYLPIYTLIVDLAHFFTLAYISTFPSQTNLKENQLLF